MPTYEYQCQKCQHQFELFQSITAKPLRACPECKGRVKRLMGTGAGLLFKGSGFYITDYRKPGYKEAAKQDSSATTPAATGAKDGSRSGATAGATVASAKPAAKPSAAAKKD